jgi:co-chaperonin GroES (HSP10)
MNTPSDQNQKQQEPRMNKWDRMCEGLVAQGKWIVLATERGLEKSGAGIYMPPKRDVFSRVISVGSEAQKELPDLKKGDRVTFKEGFKALPDGYEKVTSRDYSIVYCPNIMSVIPADAEVARLGAGE